MKSKDQQLLEEAYDDAQGATIDVIVDYLDTVMKAREHEIVDLLISLIQQLQTLPGARRVLQKYYYQLQTSYSEGRASDD